MGNSLHTGLPAPLTSLTRPCGCILRNPETDRAGAPGWLRHLSILLLVAAQVMISRFPELEPHIGLHTDSAEPAWDPLSPSLCPSPTCAVSVSLIIHK